MFTYSSIVQLIENNFLSPFKLYSVKLADTSNLHMRAGDYKNNEVSDLMEEKITQA